MKAFSLTTLETPKDIFCFINNIDMQNDNFSLFWIRKKIVAEIKIFLTKKIPESKISNPEKSFDHPRQMKSGAPPLDPVI